MKKLIQCATSITTRYRRLFRQSGNSNLGPIGILLALTILTFDTATAQQSPDFLWANQMSGTFSIGQSVCIDEDGNVYSTGTFGGTVDFDPGSETFYMSGAGADDAYISKMDNAGNFVWVKALLGVNGMDSKAIALDADGNVYSTGSFVGTADFDPGIGVFNLTAFAGLDIYISKLDNAGNFVWAKAFAGTGVDERALAIAIEPVSGNVYTTGYFNGTTDFDPGIGSFNLTSATPFDVFISKLDNAGNFSWAKSLEGNSQALSICLDHSGNVYTAGGFFGSVDFDPGASTVNLVSSDSVDIFICKLNSEGNFVWVKQFEGIGFEWITSLKIDPNVSGDIYAVGEFGGTTDFDPGTETYNLISNGSHDIFILKVDSSGNFGWAKAVGGLGGDYAKSLAINPANLDVYATGSFAASVDFDPGDGAADTSFEVSAGGEDIFIVKLDAMGNFVWAKAIGGTEEDGAQAMALDPSGNVLLTGYFRSGSIAFDGKTFTNPDGNYDAFVAKLKYALVATENIESTSEISVYPNPASDMVFVSCPLLSGKAVEISVADITGKVIFKLAASNAEKTEVDLNGFLSGMYLIIVQSADFVATSKVIVAK